jgi:hypothetical protein
MKTAPPPVSVSVRNASGRRYQARAIADGAGRIAEAVEG